MTRCCRIQETGGVTWRIVPPWILVMSALLGISTALAADQMQPYQAQYLPITAEAHVGAHIIQLEVAQTPRELTLGLMYRPELPADRGMLFPADPRRPPRMWMKNMLIPLDILFIGDGRILGIAADLPPCREAPCPTYGIDSPGVDMVLELRAGRAAELGLREGDPIEFLAN